MTARRNGRLGDASASREKGSGMLQTAERIPRKFITILAITSALIWGRTIYRLAETAEGAAIGGVLRIALTSLNPQASLATRQRMSICSESLSMRPSLSRWVSGPSFRCTSFWMRKSNQVLPCGHCTGYRVCRALGTPCLSVRARGSLVSIFATDGVGRRPGHAASASAVLTVYIHNTS